MSLTEPVMRGRTVCKDIESWTDATSNTFCPMQYAMTDRNFFGELDVRHAGAIRLVHIVSTAQQVERTAKFARNDSAESILVAFQQSGVGKVEQDGRQAVLTDMSFSLFETGRPYRFRFDGPFEHLVIYVPRRALNRRVATISHLTARPIDGRKGEGAMLVAFLLELARAAQDIDSANAERFAEIGIDLLATALSGLSSNGPSTQLFRLKTQLLNNIRCNSVDLAEVAAAVGISLRTAQRLFQAEGTTPLAWLMEERLKRAASDLAASATSVTQIAFAWGFNDVTHFCRAFRAHFGQSPRDYRNNYRQSS